MCWAAAAATVINYETTSAVTPFEICNYMGIPYDRGGSIYDEQSALSKYGVSYNKIRNDMLTWDEVVNNIKKKHLIIANLKCNDGTLPAHAVTIYEYVSSSKQVKYWDSKGNNEAGAKVARSYSKLSTEFVVIEHKSFSWMTTLSKY